MIGSGAAGAVVANGGPADELRRLTRERRLRPVFQPVISLVDGSVFAYEGLIRGPGESPLHRPEAMFAVARQVGVAADLEIACATAQVAEFARQNLPGKLLVNLSSENLLRTRERIRRAMRYVMDHGVSPTQLIVELSEHERVTDPAAFSAAVNELRDLGLTLALDDYGEGRSSLRLWVEVQPEIVKIDRFFARGIDGDAKKFQAVTGLVRLAQAFGTQLIAEGIETEAELAVLRDLGVPFAQGFLFGTPTAQPTNRIPAGLLTAITSRQIAVYPETVRQPTRHRTAGQTVILAPAVAPSTPNNELAALFNAHPELHALPVVDSGTPVGLINRRAFMDRYAQPFQRELYGRKRCTAFMNPRPLIVDKATPLESLTQVLTGADQRYLADGFIVTDGGRYLGIGTGEALVRAVTEIRIEAARYANPLTFLPGNVPISEHISRLLANQVPFVACYSDLNQFKPYNDQYGYWRGDKMIKLAAQTLSAHCNPVRDFLGHVGGDDFVLLFQSEDWATRCEKAIAQFNRDARSLFNAQDIAAGGIRGEDRQGRPAFFPVTTMSIGAVPVAPREYRYDEDVASAAAAAKRQAKGRKLSLFVMHPDAAPARVARSP